MLEKTETKDIIGFFVTFLSLVAFQLEVEPGSPPGDAYAIRHRFPRPKNAFNWPI